MKSLKVKTIAVFAAFAVSMAAMCGCAQIQTSGISATSSSVAPTQSESSSENTTKATSEASQEQTDATSGQKEITFTRDICNTKLKALEGTSYAIGTTYLGELENEAALEVVLAQMGVDEELFRSNPERVIDCGGTEIWFLCFNSDVTKVSIVMGDDENGQELYKLGNPDYIFIRCVSSGEIPACTVVVDGPKTGHTAYYPYMIEEQILLPNGGTVLNQTEGIEGYIDDGETDKNKDTEEEP